MKKTAASIAKINEKSERRVVDQQWPGLVVRGTAEHMGRGLVTIQLFLQNEVVCNYHDTKMYTELLIQRVDADPSYDTSYMYSLNTTTNPGGLTGSSRDKEEKYWDQNQRQPASDDKKHNAVTNSLLNFFISEFQP